MKFAKMPAPNTTINTITPIIANRWRRKRDRAYDPCERALSSRPASTVASTRPDMMAASATSLTWSITCFFSATGGWSVVGSVIANPRIEISIHHVRDQVEDDDRHGDDEQPRHDRVEIWLP